MLHYAFNLPYDWTAKLRLEKVVVGYNAPGSQLVLSVSQGIAINLANQPHSYCRRDLRLRCTRPRNMPDYLFLRKICIFAECDSGIIQHHASIRRKSIRRLA